MFSNQIEINEKPATGGNLGNPQLFDMKQHISKQLMGLKRKSQGKFLNILNQMTTHNTKIYTVQLKQFLAVNS